MMDHALAAEDNQEIEEAIGFQDDEKKFRKVQPQYGDGNINNGLETE